MQQGKQPGWLADGPLTQLLSSPSYPNMDLELRPRSTEMKYADWCVEANVFITNWGRRSLPAKVMFLQSPFDYFNNYAQGSGCLRRLVTHNQLVCFEKKKF